MSKSEIKPKARDPVKTRAHILSSAFIEIYTKGYNGVGVRDLAKRADVTIGAFFHYFPSKRHVAYAIIDEIIYAGIMDRWIKPLSAYKNPLQGILKCFKTTFDTWPDDFLSSGCPLNNLTQELSNIDESIKVKAKAVLTEWIAKTKEHLNRAQAGGYLNKKVNTQELAEFIVTFQEGTFAMGKALNDRKIFASMYKNFKRHIDAVSTK
ncbi:TetR/AcrR family transcriptional regulator [Leptospira ognonensis]|uniref:TetR/AcrR family transcriptional regulator n=1 Tax=Leptospira ognonensis TaxID=2484945 RepID=A0A4R9JXE1_9LEPT|nr:TetR/AcrR family transcriptional regulator [Leptospira ognonensis]TGL57850.1 TetR/AcrR family transcriptional regulator [Leptospira ognonensis]